MRVSGSFGSPGPAYSFRVVPRGAAEYSQFRGHSDCFYFYAPNGNRLWTAHSVVANTAIQPANQARVTSNSLQVKNYSSYLVFKVIRAIYPLPDSVLSELNQQPGLYSILCMHREPCLSLRFAKGPSSPVPGGSDGCCGRQATRSPPDLCRQRCR